MARLLGPRPFGVFALATTIVDILNIIGKGGLTEVLIQRGETSEEAESTAFWTTVIFGVFMAVLIAVAGPGLALLYHVPEMSSVCLWLAPTCIVNSMSSIFEARLRREFRFKLLAGRLTLASVVANAVAIPLAFFGFGVFSLVVQRAISVLVQFGATAIGSKWAPRLMFNPRESLGQLRQGSAIVGAALLGVSNQKIIDLIIGLALGPVPLGYLRIAWRGVDILQQISITAFIPVAMSMFAKLQNDMERLKAAYIRTVETSALAMYPMFGVMLAFSGDFIHIFFGNKWDASVVPMQILTLIGFVAPLFHYNGIALVAMGRNRLVLIINVIEFIISAACAAWMAERGLIWAAASNIVRSLIFVPISIWIMRRETGLPLSASFTAAWKPFLGACVLVGAAMALRYATGRVMNEFLALVVSLTLAGGLFAVVTWKLSGREIAFLIERSPLAGLFKRFGLQPRLT